MFKHDVRVVARCLERFVVYRRFQVIHGNTFHVGPKFKDLVFSNINTQTILIFTARVSCTCYVAGLSIVGPNRELGVRKNKQGELLKA